MVAKVEAQGERWYRILGYLEAHGPTVQVRIDDLVFELGIPQRSLARHLARMEKLGVIQVERIGQAIGQGRLPNRYTLKVTADQWRTHGPAMIADYEAREEAARRRRPSASRVPLARVTIPVGPQPSPADKLRAEAAALEEHESFLAHELVENAEAPITDVDGWLV